MLIQFTIAQVPFSIRKPHRSELRQHHLFTFHTNSCIFNDNRLMTIDLSLNVTLSIHLFVTYF
jgi:hypothetical protein